MLSFDKMISSCVISVGEDPCQPNTSLIEVQYLANIFQGRIEYELIYSPRGAKHRVDYSVHIR